MITTRLYQQCMRCVMDTTDEYIRFDDNGFCNHCTEYLKKKQFKIIPGKEGSQALNAIVDRIRIAGKRKKYDVIMGLSGGCDSSYVAYLAREFNLRILIVHLDNGWNSELSVNNIEKCIAYTNADLYTHVIDWEEFKSLQLAYLRAGVIDIEALTDHAIRAVIYKLTYKYKIGYNLSGANFATEGILPESWVYNKLDYKNIRSINARFGNRIIRTFPGMSFLEYAYYRAFARITPVDILNYVDYKVEKAISDMETNMGWKYYGGKHQESIFTKFYQGYILPEKFNVDKRLAHYSSLICSGNLTREEAINKLQQPVYSQADLANDKEYVLKKFGLLEKEFDNIMSQPPVSHLAYGNNNFLFKLTKRFK
jgi:N-acetyl sugar amidotransferase